MQTDFSRALSLLRQEKGLSQRKVATALGISQALLSHYENGAREPGLAFVAKASTYYGVSADFLLGRTMMRDGTAIHAEALPDASDGKDNILKSSAAAMLSKKLLVNSISLLMDLCGRSGSRTLIVAVTRYFSASIYRVFRMLYEAGGFHASQFFSTPPNLYEPAVRCEAALAEAQIAAALTEAQVPDLSHDALNQTYPLLTSSLLTLAHQTGERMDKAIKER